jgi:hypothetical protein
MSSAPELPPPQLRRVLVASSLGTLFEWYDFYLYGALAVFFGGLFFPTGDERTALLTGQFYALTFLQKELGLDWQLAYTLVAIALALGTPLFIVFGRLSDRTGRKRIMLAGCLLAALTYVPIYVAMTQLANPDGVAKVTALPLDRAAGVVDPLHVDVPALPPRQRLVRRLPPADRHRGHDLGVGRRHFRAQRPLHRADLSDRGLRRHRDRRRAVHPRDQGPRDRSRVARGVPPAG